MKWDADAPAAPRPPCWDQCSPLLPSRARPVHSSAWPGPVLWLSKVIFRLDCNVETCPMGHSVIPALFSRSIPAGFAQFWLIQTFRWFQKAIDPDKGGQNWGHHRIYSVKSDFIFRWLHCTCCKVSLFFFSHWNTWKDLYIKYIKDLTFNSYHVFW